MHPQMQQVFIKYLMDYYHTKLQGLITTHSNEMVRTVGLSHLRVISSIHYQLLLLWGIELIQNGQCSSEHGQPKCWIHLQSRVMFLIKAD